MKAFVFFEAALRGGSPRQGRQKEKWGGKNKFFVFDAP
jgi:hypothetical protein